MAAPKKTRTSRTRRLATPSYPPDASASPIDAGPVEPSETEGAPEPKPVSRRRRIVRPVQEAAPAPEATAPVPEAAAPVPEVVAPVEAPVAPKKAKRGRPSKIEQFADRIGVMSDLELAALAGVALSTARAWRKGKGIAAPAGEGGVAPKIRTRRARKPVPAPVAAAREAAPVAWPPSVAPVATAPVPVASPPPAEVIAGGKAFLVVTDEEREFVVLADDFAEAALLAVRRLARLQPGAQVVALEYLADNLPE